MNWTVPKLPKNPPGRADDTDACRCHQVIRIYRGPILRYCSRKVDPRKGEILCWQHR